MQPLSVTQVLDAWHAGAIDAALCVQDKSVDQVQAEALAVALANTSTRRLVLRLFSIADQDLARILTALPVSLQHLEIWTKTLDRSSTTSVTQAVSTHRSLQTLTIRSNSMDDANAVTLCSVLQNEPTPVLTALEMAMPLGREATGALSLAMTDNTQLKTLIVTLNEQGANETPALMKSIGINTALHTLVLHAPNTANNAVGRGLINREGLAAIAGTLLKNHTLARLELHQCFDHDNDVLPIAEAIGANVSLQELAIKHSILEDVATAAFATALYENTNLRSFELESKNISSVGVEAIATMLTNNKTLTSLMLMLGSVGDQAMTVLALALAGNASLQVLEVRDEELGLPTAEALAETLKVNQALTTLHLRSTHIGDRGADVLAQAAQVNRTLTTLRLWSSEIREQGIQKLVDATPAHLTLDLRWNPIQPNVAKRFMTQSKQKSRKNALAFLSALSRREHGLPVIDEALARRILRFVNTRYVIVY